MSNLKIEAFFIDDGYDEIPSSSDEFVNREMNFDEFKRIIEMLPNPEAILAFVRKFSEKLGIGSSRAVFAMSPQKVIKIAMNQAGLDQNESEIQVNKELEGLVPQVYDYHPVGYWLEMERVEPIIDLSDVEGYDDYEAVAFNSDYADLGEIIEIIDQIDLEDLKEIIPLVIEFDELDGAIGSTEEEEIEIKNKKEIIEDKIGEHSPHEDAYYYYPIIQSGLSMEQLVRLQDLSSMAVNYGIGDLSNTNLGINSEGEFVLLDFGYDDQIASRYTASRYGGSSNKYLDTADFYSKTSSPNPAKD